MPKQTYVLHLLNGAPEMKQTLRQRFGPFCELPMNRKLIVIQLTPYEKQQLEQLYGRRIRFKHDPYMYPYVEHACHNERRTM